MRLMFTWQDEAKVFKIVHLFLLGLFLLLIAFSVSQNPAKAFPIAGLGLGYMIIVMYRHFLLSSQVEHALQWVLPYLEGTIVFLISYIDGSSFGLSLFMVTVMDIALDYRTGYATVYVACGYIVYITRYLSFFEDAHFGMQIHLFLIGLFQISIFIGFALLAKNYNLQTKNLRALTAELNARIVALEEMTLLKERSRIAGEIHNTLGHQLTTALVQIEAANLLKDTNPLELDRRLNVVKDQLRQGLQEIRRAIHAIEAEQDYQELSESLDRLFRQIEKNTAIRVDASLQDVSDSSLETRKMLYHAIMEAITNGIRHGQCTNIQLRLLRAGTTLHLSVFNNGIVPKDLQFGFGLNRMKQDLTNLGGTLSPKLNEKGWFGITAEIPLYPLGGANSADHSHYAR